MTEGLRFGVWGGLGPEGSSELPEHVQGSGVRLQGSGSEGPSETQSPKPKARSLRADEREGGPVHHPSHYNGHPSGVECIDIIEEMSLNIGTAMKYLWRVGLKESETPDQELAKAAWYIQRERERLQRQFARKEEG